MSIVDKLKNTLSKTILGGENKSFTDIKEEIVNKDITEETIAIADEEFELVEPEKSNIVSINPTVEKVNKFEDLAMELVNKIKKTPYWEEFPMQSQEKMISKYFDKKIKTRKYVEIPYSLTDKLTFIEEVLKSVV